MLSSSRTEPPGWMMAVIPAAWAALTQSSKGKNASEAITEPLTFSPPYLMASSRAVIRLVWPGPTPTVALSLASHNGVGFGVLHHPHGEFQLAHLLFGGGPLGDHLQVVSVKELGVQFLDQQTAGHLFHIQHVAAVGFVQAGQLQEADVLFLFQDGPGPRR